MQLQLDIYPGREQWCRAKMQPQRQKRSWSGFSATSPRIRSPKHTRYQHYVRTRLRRKPSWGSGAAAARPSRAPKFYVVRYT